MAPLSRCKDARASKRVPVYHLKCKIAGKQKAVAAADCRAAGPAYRLHPGLELAIEEPGLNVQAYLNTAFHTFDNANDLFARLPGPALAHGKEINKPDAARIGMERRFEDERIIEISAFRPVRSNGRDLAIAVIFPIE